MSTKPHMTAKLWNVMRNLHFVDVWRETYPSSRVFSCYTPTHGAYSCLDKFLLANDGSLDVRRVVYQARFLSDHAPLLLECATHMPRPAIPLWRLRPDLLGDPEYKKDLQDALVGYFHTNWGKAGTRGLEWETLKVVIRGEKLSKTYGIRQHLDRELTCQEQVLAALQRQVDNGDASEVDCLEVRGRIVDLWDRLENYVRRSYRQRLFWDGDRSGRMLAWFFRRERPVPIIQMLRNSSGERILGQLRVNVHLREHLGVVYASPCRVGETQIQKYLNGLRLPCLAAAQVEELEGEISLEDLGEALRGASFVVEAACVIEELISTKCLLTDTSINLKGGIPQP
ncbi:hypothetical protein NDU88_000108 [Pleurodeles waltl]|uniref:Uncharacterized protein n=1 Tax=Pleurodeles waltl TaxID=8319 RepID=A0AAV7VWF5_PLEWA|nr:hypothetical protein NDU88_000108 [Pleurodeles waltl]